MAKIFLPGGQQLLASTMAGIAFNNGQVAMVHALAHTAGGMFKVPHGLANSIFLPHVVRFNMDVCGDRYTLIARSMGLDMKGINDENSGEAVANAISALTKKMGVPQKLREVGVPEEGLAKLAENTLADGAIVYNPKPVSDAEEVLGVLKNAW